MQQVSEAVVAELKLWRPPWAHQSKEWVESLDMNERLLLWDMGTGKTTTAVGWLRLKYRRYGLHNTLIIAPLATLPGWVKDFQKNSPESVYISVLMASGMGKKKMPGKKRAELISDPKHKIIITNSESLNMPEVCEALSKKGFQYLVIDEIHRFKNPQSKRVKALLPISDRTLYRIGLTGTFILNSYMDVWAPMRIIDRGKRFGTNFYSHFRNKYFVDINAGWKGERAFPDWQPQPGLGDVITDKLSSLASRCKKEECLTLPPRLITRVDVPLSGEQQRLYDEMEDELITSVTYGDATASNALVKMLRMRQIMAGFLPVENDEDPDLNRIHMLRENPRMDALEDLLEDLTPQAKVVVWSNFRANYKEFTKLAERLKIGYAEFHGGIKNKEEEKRRFIEDPTCRVIFMNPAAGGTGVDGLQHVCNYCIYFDRSHNLEHYLQSRERIHRGGSEIHDKVTEIHLVAAGTLDEDTLTALSNKENFAENVLERLRSKYAHKTMESSRHRRG
jgi:SNF2 family DNA or RNA helicase